MPNDITNPPPAPTRTEMSNTAEYRENYANSVQMRWNLWDFLLTFGRINQVAPDLISIQNFEGVFLSPQQAKALLNLLTQQVQQYEAALGEIKLGPPQQLGKVQMQ